MRCNLKNSKGVRLGTIAFSAAIALLLLAGSACQRNDLFKIASAPPVIPVTGVIINQRSLTLAEGASAALSAAVVPADATNGEISWSSGDRSVAGVSAEGRVSAIAAGSARVTVTTADGNFSAACLVSVLPAPAYTITYDGNGSDGGSVPVDTNLYSAGAPVSISGFSTLTKTGHSADAWTGKADGGGIAVTPGTQYTMPASDVTLYARWKAVSCTLNFDSNNGSGVTAVQSALFGSTCTLDANTYTRSGYIFTGWAVTPAGVKIYGDGAALSITGDMTLYAVWQKNTYGVSFNANGGAGTMPLLPMEYDTTQNLPLNLFSYNGYNFDGWSLTPGGLPAYNDFSLFTMPASDVTLYARWKAVSCALTFDSNNGSGVTAVQSALFGSTCTLDANTYTRSGYLFTGWAVTPAGVKIYNDGAVLTINGDMTLYAVWLAAVSGVSLNRAALELQSGDNFTLVATVQPADAQNNALTWSSSNAAVAAVSAAGVVTGASGSAEGSTADITVTTVDGGWVDVCTVTVFSIPFDPELVSTKTVTGSTITYSLGGKALAASISPTLPLGVQFPTGVPDSDSKAVPYPYAIFQTELTRVIWQAVYTWATADIAPADGKRDADGGDLYSFSNPGIGGGDEFPVTSIGWRDAIVWCNALTEFYNVNNGDAVDLEFVYYNTGSYNGVIRSTSDTCIDAPYIKSNKNGNVLMSSCTATGFRLPTSVEWEFAARYIGPAAPVKMNRTSYSGIYYTTGNSASGALDDIDDPVATGTAAWYAANSSLAAKSVTGTTILNEMSLRDMCGNVREWVFDLTAGNRIIRGGGFNSVISGVQLGAAGDNAAPGTAAADLGFRFAQSHIFSAEWFSLAPNEGIDYTTPRNITFRMVVTPGVGGKFPSGSADTDTVVPDTFFIAQTEITYRLWYEIFKWATTDTDVDGFRDADGGVKYAFTATARGSEGNDGTEGVPPTAAMLEPVTNVSWRDAMIWCNALTEFYNTYNGGAADLGYAYCTDPGLTTPLREVDTTAVVDPPSAGTQDNPYFSTDSTGFRLPSAHEREFAARYIGKIEPPFPAIRKNGVYYYNAAFASGASDSYIESSATMAVAWYWANASGTTYAVKGRASNALSLFDMSGNAAEWCFDWVSTNDTRLIKGGSFSSFADEVTVSSYGAMAPFAFDNMTGFRIVRSE